MGIIKSLYNNDTLALTDTLLSLCECKTAPDRLGIGAEVDAIVSRYKSMPMADINIGQMVMEVVEILNRYGVSVPASLTMLGRSLLVVQGMLAGVSPDTNVMGIVADYVAASAAGKSAAGEKAKSVVRQLLLSGDKLTMAGIHTWGIINPGCSGACYSRGRIVHRFRHCAVHGRAVQIQRKNEFALQGSAERHCGRQV